MSGPARMQGSSAVRHSCATLNPDQPNARSPERAQRPRVFSLTLTYMEVGKPSPTPSISGLAVPRQLGSEAAQFPFCRQHSRWLEIYETATQHTEDMLSGGPRVS